MVQHTYNGWLIDSSIWSIKRLHFQWPCTTPNYGFEVTPFFDAENLRNGTRYKHSFSGILTGTYTRPTQQCHFEWPWLTLRNLAKYSMTRSVVRSLCDSWASCQNTPKTLKYLAELELCDSKFQTEGARIPKTFTDNSGVICSTQSLCENLCIKLDVSWLLTSRHEKWHTEFPSENSPSKNLQCASVKR